VIDPAVTGLFALGGLLFGSFFNVCIHRLPRRESLLRPASHCPACSRPLSWFENVPVVSWLALGGRCRGCRTAISPIYPAVELVTAGLFAMTYVSYGFQPLLLPRLLLCGALVVLFMIDFRHHILPDVVTLPGIAAGFGASLVLPPGPIASLLGIGLGAGGLFALSEAYYRLRGHEGLGRGDVKMLAMIGAFLGWQLMLLTLFLASAAGSMVGMALVVSGRGRMTSRLPFGTFLAIGALASAFVGNAILVWYQSLYS
jgi:leader peptidase (prepilin peptidase) / N-methyltransferase